MDATMAARAAVPAAAPRVISNKAVWLVAAAAFGLEMAVSGR